MTKLLEQVVSKVRQLSDAGQDFLAHLILAEIEAKKISSRRNRIRTS